MGGTLPSLRPLRDRHHQHRLGRDAWLGHRPRAVVPITATLGGSPSDRF